MRWFFEDGEHRIAAAILSELVSGASVALVPEVWRYEVSAVLARAQKSTQISADAATDFFEELAALPIRIDDESGHRVFTDVHVLAVTHRLTSYDAAYLELARRSGHPLATFDKELIAACAATAVQVFRGS